MDVASSKVGLLRLPLRAAAFVALVCITIVGLSAWREWGLRDITLKAAEVDLANLAHSLTQHAEDSLDLMDTGIVGVVSRLETDGTGQETISKLRKVLVARKESLKRIHSIVICDESGNWLTSSGPLGANVADREYFRHHSQSTARGVFIGHPIKSDTDAEWVITVSRRFNHLDGAAFAGVVFATVSASYFSEFYRQLDIGADGSVALVSADGIIMARSPDNDTYVGRDTSSRPLFRDAALQSASGVYYFVSPLDGAHRVSFYRRSDRFPLLVLATRQQEAVLAPWRNAAIARMTFVTALISLIGIIGFFLVRQLHLGQGLVFALAAKEANFRMLAEGSSDMVTRIGLDERIHYASPSSVRIVGWLPDQLVGTPALAGVNSLDLSGVEEKVAALKRGEAEETRITYRTRHREKSEIWVESTLRVTRKVSGEIDGVIAISRDMTLQKDMEGKLATLAIEDGLTGLSNRRRFDERLLEEWGRAYREKTSVSLLMVDLDRFKAYNDEYGHVAGDECLRAVARILAAEAQRTTDLAARYGGEEFVMLLPHTDAAGCARIGESILRKLRDAGLPHALNPPSGLVTASLGGAVSRPGAERSAGPVSLVATADRALYAAKDAGRGRLVMATPAVRLLPVASASR
jgi:diguanylate cyclase (GGDEF)-like protein/PAS domain S-box-containing protein